MRAILMALCLLTWISASVSSQGSAANPNALFPACKEDKWGYISRTGKVVVPFQFTEAEKFSQNLALVRFADGSLGYINSAGKTVFKVNADRAFEFTDGLARFIINGDDFANEDAQKQGYVDLTGKVVIAPQFSYAYEFSEGLASVQMNGKRGYIDHSGKFVIPLKLEDANSFVNGLALVKQNGKYLFINKMGKTMFGPYSYADEFSDGMASFTADDGRCGYIDSTGKVLLPAVYFGCAGFHEGLARVQQKRDSVYSLIDRKGIVLMAELPRNTMGFHEGRAWFEGDSHCGYLDKRGKVAINPQFYSCSDFEDGLAQVGFDQNVWGYIDIRGKAVWRSDR